MVVNMEIDAINLSMFIAIFSLILLSSAFIYFHNPIENKEKNEQINLK